MSIRSFIFCDGCNPQGVRTIHDDTNHDRRNSDGRSWYEGSLYDAVKFGWKINQGDIMCPHCVENDVARLLLGHPPVSNIVKLNT